MTSLRTNVRMFERDGLPELADSHPVNRAIDHLLSFETPAQKWLREVGPRARELREEMEREASRG